MFWDNFTNLCNINNTSPNAVAKSIGASNATCTKWKNGSIPNGETLFKLADYFNCSIDYLLGRAENTKSYSNILSDQTDIDSQAEEFLRKFFKLSKENRDTILTLIDKLNKS